MTVSGIYEAVTTGAPLRPKRRKAERARLRKWLLSRGGTGVRVGPADDGRATAIIWTDGPGIEELIDRPEVQLLGLIAVRRQLSPEVAALAVIAGETEECRVGDASELLDTSTSTDLDAARLLLTQSEMPSWMQGKGFDFDDALAITDPANPNGWSRAALRAVVDP